MDKKMRDAYIEKMEAQLREWNAKIDQLKAKGDIAKADAKVKYYKKVKDLTEKSEGMRRRLDEMKVSGIEAWDELKLGLEKAWIDLKSALDRATETFK